MGKFYRVGIIDTVKYQFHGEVKDYYINGKPQMKGRFQANIKVDTFYFYYPSGQLMTKGRYVDNVRYGIWMNYYENGKVKDKLVFNRDFIAAIEYYDENGNSKMVNGTGDWETQYFNDLVNDVITLKGPYKDTLRHGTWNYYKKSIAKGDKNDTRLECTEVYKDGNFVKGKYYWGGGGVQDISSPTYDILPESTKFEKTETWKRTHTLSIESYPYLKFLPKLDSTAMQNSGEWYRADKSPEFPGGMPKFYSYIEREFKCSGINRGTDQKLFVEFLVDSTGYVRKGSVKFVKGNMGQVCKDKLVTTLENCPKRKPGRVTDINKDVPVRMMLPINLN
jgi:antitoxin component YwqK of YwqJK toxin-antitoxin module